ncbi:hypothetical protein ACG2LH_03095 [Zhouia sp. PK063]|uniref:hypothetical protein n=1 Tax=Zhouia sp. PK063 TaxID=3373602 RepID=UPI00378841F5
MKKIVFVFLLSIYFFKMHGQNAVMDTIQYRFNKRYAEKEIKIKSYQKYKTIHNEKDIDAVIKLETDPDHNYFPVPEPMDRPKYCLLKSISEGMKLPEHPFEDVNDWKAYISKNLKLRLGKGAEVYKTVWQSKNGVYTSYVIIQDGKFFYDGILLTFVDFTSKMKYREYIIP